MSEYHCALPEFQGSLDLLLRLIQEEKLNITDISLAQVSCQYLDYIEKNKVDPESISDFLVVAAKLLLLKSREILPDLELNPEEEEGIEDLKQRLLEYQKYKSLSLELRKLEKRGEYSLLREVWFCERKGFLPPAKISKEDLQKIYGSILAQFPDQRELERKAIASRLALREKITLIRDVLKRRVEAGFLQLNQRGDKEGAVVTFLALLELLRKGEIFVEQRGRFQDIMISREGSR